METEEVGCVNGGDGSSRPQVARARCLGSNDAAGRIASALLNVGMLLLSALRWELHERSAYLLELIETKASMTLE